MCPMLHCYECVLRGIIGRTWNDVKPASDRPVSLYLVIDKIFFAHYFAKYFVHI